MGVGSQRRDLESFDGGVLDHWKSLREEVPRLNLFANIGLSQLITADFKKVRKLVQDLSAQALVVHLNPLQEVIQAEGTPQFRGGVEVLRRYCGELGFPVVLKETGCGFSRSTLERLSSVGLAAIDVSGLGGTHWGRIEGARAGLETLQGLASQTFSTWGESTLQSVMSAAEILPKTEIWASGGIRSGLDAAKALAVGAHRVGYAKPALEAALQGDEQLRFWMKLQEYELKIALFCTGSLNCQVLRQKENVWKRREN
jgi:isopentenyl-diphosphate delta-isomerase